MTKIKYKLGQERDIVVEKGNFDESIFRAQYIRAAKLMAGFIDSCDDKSLKVVAFCGDRGEGKTSCASTFIEMLKRSGSADDAEGQEVANFFKSCNCLEKLRKKSFAFTENIDPSFFTVRFNVLEIIIGQLYKKFQKADRSDDFGLSTDLDTSFVLVKRCLDNIGRASFKAFDTINDLEALAASIDLKRNLEELVKRYLRFFKKDILIIPIDDIDLSLSHAYQMCEQIRKYLCIPNCIVMFSTKISQLNDVVIKAFREQIDAKKEIVKDEENPNMNETEAMAKKYLDKLIPVSSRINMPKIYDFGDAEIEIKRGDEIIVDSQKLRDCILRLIFSRTRYLFYNPVGGLSPLMPNNLREFFNLVGLLAIMDPVVDDKKQEILRSNKSLFKGYFFSVWKDRFDIATQSSLDSLLNYDFGTSFNREVVKIIDFHFGNRLKKDYDVMDDEGNSSLQVGSIIDSIIDTNNKNFGYNVTAGDVFYLFSMLEKETLSESGYALLFFLKSYYSIRMYEAYETVTEDSAYYPTPSEEKSVLSVIDHRFDNTNALQQLIGGSYFTYAPGELLPEQNDLYIVKSDEFNKLLRILIDSYKKIKELVKKPDKELKEDEKKEIKEFNLRLNTVELFILMTKCAVTAKNNLDNPVAAIDKMRKNAEAFHFRPFFKETGYYMLDVLAPFSNLMNPEFCYKRFRQIDDHLYLFILNYKESLLRNMINICMEKRGMAKSDEVDFHEQYHCLLSVAAIRNSEVLTAIKENITLWREKIKKGRDIAFPEFYKSLSDSKMLTHPTNEADPDSKYRIIFHFLKPIEQLLTTILGDDKGENADLYDSLRSVILKPQSSDAVNDVPTKENLIKVLKKRKKADTIADAILMIGAFKTLSKQALSENLEQELNGQFNPQNISQWVERHYEELINGDAIFKEGGANNNPANNHVIAEAQAAPQVDAQPADQPEPEPAAQADDQAEAAVE